MRMLTAARGAVPGLAPGKPNVEYVAMDGTLHAVPLADAAWVRLAGHAAVSPVRGPEGQRNLPGRWWSATDARHVGYESWLERPYHVAGLEPGRDRDRLAAVPSAADSRREQDQVARAGLLRRAHWRPGAGGRLPSRGQARPSDLTAFEATRQAGAMVGWEYLPRRRSGP